MAVRLFALMFVVGLRMLALAALVAALLFGAHLKDSAGLVMTICGVSAFFWTLADLNWRIATRG